MIIWQLIWMRALGQHPVRLLWYSNQSPSSNKSDHAVMVKQSRTARLPCRSPSHTPPPLGRLSEPASPSLPWHTCRDSEMMAKTWRHTQIQTKLQNTHAHVGWTLEVRFWTWLLNLYRDEISIFILICVPCTHTKSVVEFKHGRECYSTSQQVWSWPSHVICLPEKEH